MATRLRDTLMSRLGDLRFEPTEKRVRAVLGDSEIARTDAAMLVWQPRRVVPLYAVPERDLAGELVPGAAVAGQAQPPDGGMLHGRAVLAVGDFAAHTTPGDPLVLRTAGGEVAAFRPADPDLAGYVVLDFEGPDAWFEEDEQVVSHPRDPFHRVDVRRGSRHVQVELEGRPLAESREPRLVFETNLPTRWYLPRTDVREELLRPSDHRTACAYKGRATYHDVALGDRVEPHLVWTYEDPLPDAAELAGLLAFFDERVDVVVDGVRRERPVTPWSRP